MNRLVLAALLIPAVAAPLAHAHADGIRVTVQQDLAIARPSETISIPWKDVNAALPGAMVQKIAVKDARGRVLPHR